MKILVTGGAGFIGSNVVDKLIENNHMVCVIDNLSTGKIENLNNKVKFYNCDITDEYGLKEIFKKENPEVVYHFAAQIDVQKSLKETKFDAEVNILGSINVLECCREFNVRKIIYPSSAAVYGVPKYLPIKEEHNISPISFYGISKYTPEHYIKVFSDLYGIKYTILRYSNVYGVRQNVQGEGGVVSIFIDKFLNNELPVIFGDGKQTRDFIYVKDIANANLFALNKGDNEVINISSNISVSVNELLKIVKKYFDNDLDIIYKEAREADILHSCLDNELAKKTLDWVSEYSLIRGIEETINYYKDLHNLRREKL